MFVFFFGHPIRNFIFKLLICIYCACPFILEFLTGHGKNKKTDSLIEPVLLMVKILQQNRRRIIAVIQRIDGGNIDVPEHAYMLA
jgi:hypothetical protein